MGTRAGSGVIGGERTAPSLYTADSATTADGTDLLRLDEDILRLLDGIDLAPRRLLLDTGAVRATTSMLRGVWGRALKDSDAFAYERVFRGRREDSPPGAQQAPLYLMRPAPTDPDFAPALDWILFGAAIRYEEELVRAWEVAGRLGLGPDREPLRIRQVRWLRCDGTAATGPQRWSLRTATEAVRHRFAGAPRLRLHFRVPLRLLRRGHLIERPTLVDISLALLRRALMFADGAAILSAGDFSRRVLAAAEGAPASRWRGDRRDFVRWSGAQHREVEMRGVTGSLELPAGAGDLWPLLVAGCWTHLGKGTVFGLGQMTISPP